MTIIEAFQLELENEAVTTRKMLSLVPNEQYAWKPHSRSMNMQQLSTHIAEIPGWVGLVLNSAELDFAQTPYSPEVITDTPTLLSYFDKCITEAKEALQHARMEQLDEPWVLRNGEDIYSSSSKYEMLRSVFSQVIHHRAQLGVYLRLLDIPIPGSYGPSADEHS